ncbi:MAG TPA: ATP-dependent DNA ligase [Alphaproteobacteria bacterium]|nr:ATP-dependent DNA ligase [Alphaproteobacteria bacterium]
MEARSVEALPADPGWQYEPKWDGFRCLAIRDGAGARLFAKSGKGLGRYFPEVVGNVAALPADGLILDGELVIMTPEGLSFDALQLRLHPAESRIRKLAAEIPAVFVAFDLPRGPGGRDLRDSPLVERRAALETFLARPASGILLSPVTRDHAEARRWLEQAGGAIDGVVCKRLDGVYAAGERAMLKVKHIRSADCVVGGFRYGTNSREVRSLLLGLYDEAGRLDHVGFTSGFVGINKQELTARLEAMRGEGFTGNAPGGPSRWATERTGEYVPLRHELVVEVLYDHVSGGRFRHGTRIHRWRPDKAPRQCTYEQIRPSGEAPAPISAFLDRLSRSA